MASKKRRARATKAPPHPTSGGLSLPSSSNQNRTSKGGKAPVVPGMMTQGIVALRRHGGDVTRGRWIDSPQSPLMRLPRNVRDIVYAMVLTTRTKTYEQVQTESHDERTEICYQSARPVAIIEPTEILPGSSQRYPFIRNASGLLLTNKQLHSECNAYLFSNNNFVIMPEWERIHCFWSCNNIVCRPDIPCLVHMRNLRQIKKLYILVNNPHHFEDKSHKYAANRLRKNIETMVKCLKETGIKLLTLRVRYVSCLQGQIDSIRAELNTDPNNQRGSRTVTVYSAYTGKGYSFGADEDHGILFQNTNVLDKLKDLPDIAQSVSIIGDLPTSYITELTGILTGPSSADADMEDAELVVMGETQMVVTGEAQTVVTENKATQFPEKVFERIPEKPEKNDAEARAALLQKLSLDHPDDKEIYEFCERTMRGPMYTPAFMERMLVPSQEEVDRFRAALKEQKRRRSKK